MVSPRFATPWIPDGLEHSTVMLRALERQVTSGHFLRNRSQAFGCPGVVIEAQSSTLVVLLAESFICQTYTTHL